jgi:hypothetical protein
MRLPQIVIAIDPGLCTGFAVLRLNTPDDKFAPLEVVYSAELDPMETKAALRTALEWAVEYYTQIEVVVEKFTITPETGKKTQAPWSLEIIGGIRWVLDDFIPGAQPILQAAGDAKSLIPNPKLKDVGIWHRGGAGHARDALRHGVYRYVTRGWQGAGLA